MQDSTVKPEMSRDQPDRPVFSGVRFFIGSAKFRYAHVPMNVLVCYVRGVPTYEVHFRTCAHAYGRICLHVYYT